MSPNTIEELERILRQRKGVKISRESSFISASVMVILREKKNEYSMLFIKRPQKASDPFSGHIAFPGGKMKKGDESRLDTAIRETLEETGIDLKKNGKILGELDDVSPINPKVNHYIVAPYIALVMGGVEVKPNEEVAEFVWIPLSDLKNEKTFEVRVVEKSGMKLEDFTFCYRHYVIWGMTARILLQFLSIVGYLF